MHSVPPLSQRISISLVLTLGSFSTTSFIFRNPSVWTSLLTDVFWGYNSSLAEVKLNYIVVTVSDLAGTAYQDKTSCAIETVLLYSSSLRCREFPLILAQHICRQVRSQHTIALFDSTVSLPQYCRFPTLYHYWSGVYHCWGKTAPIFQSINIYNIYV